MREFQVRALLVLLALVSCATAHKSYQAKLPNGADDGCPAVGHVGCVACKSPTDNDPDNPPQSGGCPTEGAAARNAFGQAFAATTPAALTWTKALCEADSDGDGQSNGLELGDPCCVWSLGKGPDFADDLSNPGDRASTTARVMPDTAGSQDTCNRNTTSDLEKSKTAGSSNSSSDPTGRGIDAATAQAEKDSILPATLTAFAAVCALCLLANKCTPGLMDSLHQRKLGRPPPSNSILHNAAVKLLTEDFILAATDLSVGEALLLTLFAAVNIYFVAVFPPLIMVLRPGVPVVVAIGRGLGHCNVFNLTVASLPASRTTLWIHVFGVSFERAVKFHRIVARTSVLIVMPLHMILMVSGGYELTSGIAVWGLASGCCFWLLGFLTIEPIRRCAFEVFYYGHFLFIPGTVLAAVHSADFRWALSFPVALYVVDRILRVMYKYRYSVTDGSAVLVTPPQGGGPMDASALVRLVVPQDQRMPFLEGGEFFFVNIPAISPLQWHPFSVSAIWEQPVPEVSNPLDGVEMGQSQPQQPQEQDRQEGQLSTGGEGGSQQQQQQQRRRLRTHRDCFVFHVKPMGGSSWTSKLSHFASSPASQQPLAVNLDGPYGLLSVRRSTYRSVLLVAGGIGITPMHFILQRIMDWPVKDQVVRLLWVTREVNQLVEFGPALRAAVLDNCATVSVFDTFKPGGSSSSNSSSSSSAEDGGQTSSGAGQGGVVPAAQPYLSAIGGAVKGRPDFEQEVDRAISAAGGACTDAAVLVCGPELMVASVQTAAQARGCHFHKETFFL